MKEVIQSIRPSWVDLIFKGLKILELRKSKPSNIDYPFKVYIYETKPGAGAVVGEYICNGIISSNLATFVESGSCVPLKDIQSYMGDGKIFGWNITSVVKYETPKPLSEYGLARAPQSWCYASVA